MRSAGPTILQIIPKLDAGGAELAVVDMAEAIVKAGGRALVLAEPGRLQGRVEEAGGEVITFPAATKNPLRIAANAGAIVRLIVRENVRLVHARSRAPAWSALMAARRAKVPFVTTYHGAYSEGNGLKRAYNSVMARGDMTIANSAYTARLIAGRYGTPAERLVVIHRGVDPRVFDPARVAIDKVRELRGRWGASSQQKIVLQAARLTGWKGQRVLIEAAGLLKADGRLGDVMVVLAGDAQGRDGYVEGLQARIAELGLGDTVRIVGHVDSIAAAYLAAHVTVVPSTKPEAFGRSVIEASAMGSPVIATDIGAPPETVKAPPAVEEIQATGWLVPPSAPKALADGVAHALAMSDAERVAMGTRSREHVLGNFTTELLQVRTLAVYDRLLGSDLERRFSATLPAPGVVANPQRQT